MSQLRQGFTVWQIGLHWIIAALVIFQLVFGETMNVVMRATARGTSVSASDQWWADVHYWIGIAVLVLVVIRLAVRMAAGAPAALAHDWTQTAARLMHGAFYLLLLATPILGLLGFYLGDPWGDIHALSKPVFIVLVGLHVCAAIYHQFWLKDGTLRRMLVPAA
jgi:cytochrome b561